MLCVHFSEHLFVRSEFGADSVNPNLLANNSKITLYTDNPRFIVRHNCKFGEITDTRKTIDRDMDSPK
ncbi:hypothetical protein OK016_00720 [Vibrio chagasii]|nr:hypothetical protein [Vibrio chagasii]